MARTISQDRYEDSYNSREGNSGKKGVFKWPKGVQFFKAVEGPKNKINIVPYVIKSKHHPLVKAGKAEIGDIDYVLDVFVHRSVGPMKQDVICPKKTYNGICPICDAAQEFYQNDDKKSYDAIKAKRRVFYNVEDVNDPDKGLMVFEASHPYFEKELIDAARDASEDGPILPFADIKDGKTIKFKGVAPEMGKNIYEFKSFTFLDREEELSDKLIDKAISFDELITLHSAEELNKILYGGGDEDVDDDDDDKPAPTKKASKPVKEDEDEEDDEEEAKPPKKATKSDGDDADGPTCPHKGGKFGKDTDKYEECEDECKHYRACLKASR